MKKFLILAATVVGLSIAGVAPAAFAEELPAVEVVEPEVVETVPEVVEPADPVVEEPVVEVPVVEEAPVVEEVPVESAPVEQVVVEPPVVVAEPVVIDTVPEAPTFIDRCGTDRDDVILPADTDAYTYNSVEVAAGGQALNDATVWVVLADGFAFSDEVLAQFGNFTPVWDHSFDSTPCIGFVQAPTFVDECGVAGDDVVVPADTALVTYHVVRVSAGSHLLNDATVWASAADGLEFGEGVDVVWDHSFTDESCPAVAASAATPAAPVAPVATAEPTGEDTAPVTAQLAHTGVETAPALWAALLAFAGILLLAARRFARI